MRTYVLKYTFGELLDKESIQGITCPICGQNKLVALGRLGVLGWGFKCQICNKPFYLKIGQVDSTAVRNKPSNVEL